MRMFLIALLAANAPFAAGAQTPSSSHHHGDVDERGARVMGFDQQMTVHHFLLYEDGGAIDVTRKDSTDTASLDAIRTHLPHIASMFAQGRFDAPMLVHATDVPGTSEMARLKERLTYKFVETPDGGRVDVVTADPDALAAVHRFLIFQIADHRTGDSTSIRKR